jgi:allantoicase
LFFTSCLFAQFKKFKTNCKIIKQWKYLLKDAKLSANKVHVFKNNLMKKDKINFIKINIFPDGGISRFRIYGKSI